MKLDQSLMNTVRKHSNGIILNNFEKIVNELNFKDGMTGLFWNGEGEGGDLYIEVKFDNFWRLTVWDDGDITFNNDNGNGITLVKYNELLKFMDDNGIRKTKEEKYKDAELYVVDFNR